MLPASGREAVVLPAAPARLDTSEQKDTSPSGVSAGRGLSQELGPEDAGPRDRPGAAFEVGNRAVRIDAQQIERRGEDVLGREGRFHDVGRMFVRLADEVPAPHATARVDL